VPKPQILSRVCTELRSGLAAPYNGAYFEQLAAERRVVRFVRGRPVSRFELRPGVNALRRVIVWSWAAPPGPRCPFLMLAHEQEVRSASPRSTIEGDPQPMDDPVSR
jgi:hypothetical protein